MQRGKRDFNKPASQFYGSATICMFQLHHPFRITNVNVLLLFEKLIHAKIASKISTRWELFSLAMLQTDANKLNVIPCSNFAFDSSRNEASMYVLWWMNRNAICLSAASVQLLFTLLTTESLPFALVKLKSAHIFKCKFRNLRFNKNSNDNLKFLFSFLLLHAHMCVPFTFLEIFYVVSKYCQTWFVN